MSIGPLWCDVANDAATIPLTFDGIDIQFADFGIHLEIVEGLNEGPTVRGVDVIVPALDGRVARNRRADTRRIVLAGHVMGNGATQALRQADYRDNVTTIQTLFDPTGDPAALVATLETGDDWTIDARTLNVIWPHPEQVPSEFAYITIELESVTPNWSAVVVGS